MRDRGPQALTDEELVVAILGMETTEVDVRTIARLKEYRTALISAAVTGKIDVREETD